MNVCEEEKVVTTTPVVIVKSGNLYKHKNRGSLSFCVKQTDGKYVLIDTTSGSLNCSNCLGQWFQDIYIDVTDQYCLKKIV